MTDFAGLVEGYRRFKANGWQLQRQRWSELAERQTPKLMVIACSDSRVDPTIIFDTSPGEIFMVRNVANMVPPFETTPGRHGVSAALEFAVTQLEIPEIVVLGHQDCGGCGAVMSQRFENKIPGEGGFIADWMSLLDDAREKVVAEHRLDVTVDSQGVPKAVLDAIEGGEVELRALSVDRERREEEC